MRPGSICWACGKQANPWWTDANGDRRCDDCHTTNAPIDPKHRGKRSDMDRLPPARRHKFDPLNNWRDFHEAYALAPDEERAGWRFLDRYRTP